MPILRVVRRMLNARRYGIIFVRNRWFKLPQKIKVHKTWLKPAYPDEYGVLADFLVCFVHDDYGLANCPAEPANIVDIGANVGWFALAARGRYPHAKLHCYEPNPRALSFLQSNAKADGITVFAEAVGGESGYVHMIDSGDSNQATTEKATEGIPQVGFATVVQRLGHIDLLKMDCEGAEWEIFQAREAWRNVRELRMEYHLTGGRTVADVKSALQALEFSITHLIECGSFGSLWATNRQFEPGEAQAAEWNQKLAS